MNIDFTTLSATQAYHLMTQAVVPRPIAWVLTANQSNSREDHYNLAPFSYFNSVASDPPTLMISIGRQADGSEKDTLANIQRTGELVIHIAGTDQLDALNQSAASLPYGKSELTASALTTAPLEGFTLPRLGEAKIAFACVLDHIYEIGQTPQSLVFANIQSAYLSDDIVQIDEEKSRMLVDIMALDPLARLGSNHYASLAKPLSRKRPQ